MTDFDPISLEKLVKQIEDTLHVSSTTTEHKEVKELLLGFFDDAIAGKGIIDYD